MTSFSMPDATLHLPQQKHAEIVFRSSVSQLSVDVASEGSEIKGTGHLETRPYPTAPPPRKPLAAKSKLVADRVEAITQSSHPPPAHRMNTFGNDYMLPPPPPPPRPFLDLLPPPPPPPPPPRPILGLLPPPPPPPPRPFLDLLWKYHLANQSEVKTISDHNESTTSYLTGGRTNSERVMPQYIDLFVSEEITGGAIKTMGLNTFFERLGMDPLYDTNDLSVTTPYNFVASHGKDVMSVVDDFVLINPRQKTVLKFLRSKKNVRKFLMNMYIASAYGDLLNVAKCVAYYPSMMCAEYEHAGVNIAGVDVETVDVGNITSQILSIMKDLEILANLTSNKFDLSNFCLDLSTNKVKMTCTEWLIPSSFGDGECVMSDRLAKFLFQYTPEQDFSRDPDASLLVLKAALDRVMKKQEKLEEENKIREVQEQLKKKMKETREEKERIEMREDMEKEKEIREQIEKKLDDIVKRIEKRRFCIIDEEAEDAPPAKKGKISPHV